jgi:crossover junction endodeoxyribonuclease RuvC
MTVLGLDPGLAETGWAVLSAKAGPGCADMVECGCIRTASREPLPGRLLKVFRELDALIKKFDPEVICMEKQYLFNENSTVLATSQSRGVIVLAAAMNGKEVVEYNPKEVKIAVTGTGAAGKEQVREMVKRILGVKKIEGPLDVSDAVAVGICHINSFAMKKLNAGKEIGVRS